jgi:WD40 repeat protein
MDFLQDYTNDEDSSSQEDDVSAVSVENHVPSRGDAVGDDDSSGDDEFGPKPSSVPSVVSEPKERKSKKSKKKSTKEKKEAQVVHNEEDIDDFAKRRGIPISSEAHLVGSDKAVTCLSLEPSGNRLVSGSLDYSLKIYDFGGMDSRCRFFKSFEPGESGHPIIAISHSPSGDRFLISTGSSQPILYDREGNEIIKFVKGDMYLRDMSNTKGHTMEVTSLQWHPNEKNIVLTGSLDGTLRIWDLLGQAAFGCLINKHVLKMKVSPTSSKAVEGLAATRIAFTTCCYSLNGLKILGGTSNGLICIWNEKRIYHFPDFTLKCEETMNNAVQSIAVSSDNTKFVVRHENGMVIGWSFTNNTPLWKLQGLKNIYPSSNIIFSPDNSLILCCSSPTETDTASRLHFFDLNSISSTSSSSSSSALLAPKQVLSLVVSQQETGIFLKWNQTTNQIFLTLSNGQIKVLFDNELSKKGILLAVQKAPKRSKDPSDYAVVGEIYLPFALNMYQEETKEDKYIKRVMDLKDPIISKIPQKPVNATGPGSRANGSFFFTQYVMSTSGRQKDIRDEDPREALLKMNEKAEKDGLFIGKAYEKTQPKRIFSSTTFEQEQEDFQKKRKTDR